MTSRQGDPLSSAIGFACIAGGIGLLVAFASPIFLVGGAGAVVFWIVRGYRNSASRARRVAHMRSLSLFDEARQLSGAARLPSPATFADGVAEQFLAEHRDALPQRTILAELLDIPEALYRAEGLALEALPAPPTQPDLALDTRYQDTVGAIVTKVKTPHVVEAARTAILDSMVRFATLLSPVARGTLEDAVREERALFRVPFIQTITNAGHLVDALIGPFYEGAARSIDLFAELRRQLDQNLADASNLKPGENNPAKLIWPTDHSGNPEEVVSAYLRGTPFLALFRAELPFSIPEPSRMEHWHLIAGSGHGKTQTLQHIVMHDLQTTDDPPALFIIDSQGDMLRKLQRLALFAPGGSLTDRLVLIDPEDDVSPALNMFDVANARLGDYSRTERETIEAGVIELYNYIFGALASELTAKQNTAFAFVVRLMLVIPSATIHTFRELMEDPAQALERSSFEPAVRKLDATSQGFFQNQFFSKSFAETKQQIARRLYGVLQVPAFDRMFSSRTNRLDMFAAMQDGKVVLVNTAKALLKTDASALFGRYAIALVLKAAYERVAVPEAKRKPAYLVVDEAAEYFDSTLERLLIQARKYNLGVLFVHQYVDQLMPALRAAVAANTSIKMAGGVSDQDARAMAPGMRTSSEFVLDQHKDSRAPPKWTRFACYVRNVTPTAVSVTIPFGTLEAAPRMTDSEHRQLLAENRRQYGVEPVAETQGASEEARPKAPQAAPAYREPPPATTGPQATEWLS